MEETFRRRAIEFLGDPQGLARQLGSGQEGYVWATRRQSALKVFERDNNFNRELECYHILAENCCSKIDVFQVPELLSFDRELKVIEMTIVSPPFLLDFGKCHFERPDFSKEVMEDHYEQIKDHFGENIQHVHNAIYDLEQLGIYYWDARPGNINCSGLK